MPLTPPSRVLRALPWLAFFSCAAIWGSTFLVIRMGNDSVPPLWAASLRLLLASGLLTGLALVTRQGMPRGAARRAAGGFGFLGFGLGFCLLYWGETRVPSGLAAVMFGTIPLTSSIFAAAAGLERLSAAKLAAATVAFGGVAVLFAGRLEGEIPRLPLAAVLAASILSSLSGVVLKRGPRQPALGANAVAAGAGAAVCLLGSFMLGESHALPRSPAEWFPILYLTLAGSLGAFVIFAWLVNRWPVSRRVKPFSSLESSKT